MVSRRTEVRKVSDIQDAVKAAMKAKDKTRVETLRILLNEVKLMSKNDGNRLPRDSDVVSAASRIVKRNRETLSFIPEGDERRDPIEAEIAIVQEFLPRQMSRAELEQVVSKLVEQGRTGGEDKAIVGYVMKNLKADYAGQFEAREANEIVKNLV